MIDIEEFTEIGGITSFIIYLKTQFWQRNNFGTLGRSD